MTTMTVDQINKMSAPMLRKAVKDAGEDPMAAKFGKGAVDKLKAFLIGKIKTPKAPPRALPKPVAPKAVPAKSVVARPGAKPAPAAARVLPKPVAPKAAAKPAPVPPRPVAKPAPAKPAPVLAAKAGDDMRQWRETIELRLATIEASLGVSQGKVEEAAVPEDALASLADFLTVDEAAGEQTYALGADEVQTLNAEQLMACGVLFGQPFAEGTAVRTMRATVGAMLAKLSGDTAGPAEPEAEAVEYEEGHVVVASYAGEPYDPCRIEKVIRNKAGAVTGYDVLFAADNTVAKCKPEEILGLSEQEMPE